MAKQPGAELSTKKSIICYFISVNNFLYVIMTLEASWQPTIELVHFSSLKNTEFQRWRTSYPYPQSHMRNVARKASQTNYVFLTDIDIVPSKSKTFDPKTILI